MCSRIASHFRTGSWAALALTTAYLVTRLIGGIWHCAAETQNMMIVFTSALLSVMLVQWTFNFVRQVQSLPPGPWGIPILGYLTFMGNEKHTKFMELAKKFGSVYSTKLGFQLTVVLSDHNMIREAFQRKEFTGRPDTPFLKTLGGFGECFFFNLLLCLKRRNKKMCTVFLV